MPSLPAKEERGTTPERSGKVQKSNVPPPFLMVPHLMFQMI
jgi:hypothetical protein